MRYFGNSVLSLLTKIASGYWQIADSQTGYTAINKKALKTIDWDKMYKRYGQPNDLLAFFMFFITGVFLIRLLVLWIMQGHIPEITLLILIFSFTMGFMSSFFACGLTWNRTNS